MRPFRKSRVLRGPVHDLTAFQALVAAGTFHSYAGSARDRVVEVFGCTRGEAGRIIQEIVCSLTPDDYARSIQMDNGAAADEYGRMFEDLGWYVKLLFNTDDGEAEVCSCHLTRYPLKTKTGIIESYDTDPEQR